MVQKVDMSKEKKRRIQYWSLLVVGSVLYGLIANLTVPTTPLEENLLVFAKIGYLEVVLIATAGISLNYLSELIRDVESANHTRIIHRGLNDKMRVFKISRREDARWYSEDCACVVVAENANNAERMARNEFVKSIDHDRLKDFEQENLVVEEIVNSKEQVVLIANKGA